MDSAVAALDRTIGRILEVLPESRRRGFLDLSAKWEDYRRLECQTLYASFDGGTIAGPAYANCFERLSSERRVFLKDAYNLDLLDTDARGACVGYEPDTVALTGQLSQRTYPGRPNYESVARGDEAETGFYVTVETPICATRHLDEVNAPTAGVRTVQLVLDQAGYSRLRPSIGRTVTVRGTLFHAHTGHHHAELLLNVLREEK